MAEMKSLQAVIIALMIIGIVLGIGFLVITEFEDHIGDTSTSVVNETITPTEGAVYVTKNFSTDGIGCFNSFAVSVIINASDDAFIAQGGNYTVGAKGSITNLSSLGVDDWKVTYSYLSDSGEGCDGLNETKDAMGTIPDWLIIIVLILIVGILLFIVFRVFPRQSEGGYSGYSGDSGTIARI